MVTRGHLWVIPSATHDVTRDVLTAPQRTRTEIFLMRVSVDVFIVAFYSHVRRGANFSNLVAAEKDRKRCVVAAFLALA